MDIDLSTTEEIKLRFNQICACFAILVRDKTEPQSVYMELFYIANALKEKFCPNEPTNATVLDASVIKSSAITPNEFLSRLKEIDKQCNDDEETFHIQADDLICELLKSLGYGEGAEYFGNHEKWYS